MAPEKITQYPETDLWDFLRDLVIPGGRAGYEPAPTVCLTAVGAGLRPALISEPAPSDI